MAEAVPDPPPVTARVGHQGSAEIPPGQTERAAFLQRIANDRGGDLTETERDDAKQVIALAIDAAQRERESAETYYTRGRNLLAFIAALFTAIQAAFLSNLGREVEHQALLTAGERDVVLVAAVVALVLLAVAVGVQVLALDKPRKTKKLGKDTLMAAWLDPNDELSSEERDLAVLTTLALAAIEEEDKWARTNLSRKNASAWVSALCALSGLTLAAELIVLYAGLA